ncbi:MAG: hypothetical protein F6J93_22825 [Oscillatoria sp. SIO1A7]|nr:hypothetical protein [Oscillatoria sp. SIO1A7]
MTGIISTAKDAALYRISGIVEELMKNDNLYREELDHNELMQIFSGLLDEVVEPEEIIALDEDRLTKRITGIMAVELVSGMLDDLTPEQMEMFDAAVEGR